MSDDIYIHTIEWCGLLMVFGEAESELTEAALQCICTLAEEVTHFNFRTNLMTCIVARLSKKSWDKVRIISLYPPVYSRL